MERVLNRKLEQSEYVDMEDNQTKPYGSDDKAKPNAREMCGGRYYRSDHPRAGMYENRKLV